MSKTTAIEPTTARRAGDPLPNRPGRASATILLLTPLLWACGDTVRIVECPPGTRPEGSECLPIVEDDTAPTPDTVTPDTVTPDTVPDTTPVDSLTPADSSDTSDSSDVVTARPTGSPCTLNADCEGGTCLDWTGGYCTTLDCATAGCGAGETCLALLGNTLCVKNCDAGACSSPDQRCKPMPAGPESALVPVCIAVDLDAEDGGSACTDPTDCQGAATCLPSFPGGYCASLGCPDTACTAGTTCVRVDGTPSCLKTCSSSAECDSQPGAERRCGVLAGLSGGPVDVCISGVEGKALGASCGSDFECSSGTCQILGEGRCSQTNAPCFTVSVATDCNGAEFCQVNNNNRVGICSQPCSAGRSCAGAAHCITESRDTNSAWCRPTCQSVTDTGCNSAAGLSCAFGIPISDSGQGRYACTLSRTGTPLASCIGDAQCAGAACIKPASGPGYCAPACGADEACPFGGACVTGETSRCMRACFSGADCDSGFACELPAGGARDVCQP